MENQKYKTFKDIEVGDIIYQVITTRDQYGNAIKIENVPTKVIDTYYDARGKIISLDSPGKSDFNGILIATSEYGYCSKLWNNKVYCSDKKNADVEVEFKHKSAIDSINNQINYLENIKYHLEKDKEKLFN